MDTTLLNKIDKYSYIVEYISDKLKKCKTKKECYIILKHSIYYSPFVDKDTHLKVTTLLYTYNKLNLLLDKIKYTWKKKHRHVYNTETLLLEPFETSNAVQIMENNTIYQFTIKELQQIFLKSLTYSDHLLSAPMHPKNPYTNITFSLHNIYNILFLINRYKPHNFIQSYLQCNCNLELYSMYNSLPLHIESSKRYTDTLDNVVIYCTLCNIIITYTNYTCTIVDYTDMAESLFDEFVQQGRKILPDYYYIYYFEPVDSVYNIMLSRLTSKLLAFIDNHSFYFKRKVLHYTLKQTNYIHIVTTDEDEDSDTEDIDVDNNDYLTEMAIR